MIHTVQFNKPVTFTDHTGVSFVNTTTAETASLVTSATVSPADVIAYDVTWGTDPAFGEIVEWQYTPGNYRDSNDEPMEAQTLEIVNCLTLPATITADDTGSTSSIVYITEPADVSAFDEYQLFRNGSLIATLPIGSTEYTEDGILSPDTSYSYRLDTIAGSVVVSAPQASIRTQRIGGSWDLDTGGDWEMEAGGIWNQERV